MSTQARSTTAPSRVVEVGDPSERGDAFGEEDLRLVDVADSRERALIHDGHADRAVAADGAEPGERVVRSEAFGHHVGAEGPEIALGFSLPDEADDGRRKADRNERRVALLGPDAENDTRQVRRLPPPLVRLVKVPRPRHPHMGQKNVPVVEVHREMLAAGRDLGDFAADHLDA